MDYFQVYFTGIYTFSDCGGFERDDRPVFNQALVSTSEGHVSQI